MKITKACLRISTHASLLVLEGLALVVGLVVLAMGLILWRAATGPMDLGFLRPYIEDALHDPQHDMSIQMQDVMLEWPKIPGPLQLGLTGVKVMQGRRIVLSVDEASTTMSMRGLLLGQVRPRDVTLRRPFLYLIRGTDNGLSLNIRRNEIASEEGDEKVFAGLMNHLSDPDGKMLEGTPFARLRAFRIERARIMIEDRVLGLSWLIPRIDLGFYREDQGLRAEADLSLPGRSRPGMVHADALVPHKGADISINAGFEDFDAALYLSRLAGLDMMRGHDLPLAGSAGIDLGRDLTVHRARLNLTVSEGGLHLPDLYDRDIPLKNVALDAEYDAERGHFDLHQAALTLTDVPLEAQASLDRSDAGIGGSLSFAMPKVTMEQVRALWPKILKGEPAEDWLTRQISTGDVTGTKGTVTLEPDGQGGLAYKDAVVDFAFSGLDVDYRAPLTPVAGASGTGRYADDALTFTIASAKVGEMTVEKASVVLDSLSQEGKGEANIDLNLKATLPQLFDYIAKEPISMGPEMLGLKPKDVAGKADLNVKVRFPTIKDLKAEQVGVEVGATLDDVRIPDVVRGLAITGGPLTLKAAAGKAEITGKAQLDGRPVKATWTRYLKPETGTPFITQVKADIAADPDLRRVFGAELSEMLMGDVPLYVEYTDFGKGREEVLLSADLTPATLTIDPFDYQKPPGVEGRADLKLNLKDEVVQEITGLSVQSKNLKIEDTRLVFGTVKGQRDVKRGRVGKLAIGRTRVAADFEYADSGKLNIIARGDFLDASPFMDSEPQKEGTPVILSGTFTRMQTGLEEDRTINQVKLAFDTGSKGEIYSAEMDAIAGKGSLLLRYKPDRSGQMGFRFEADDAGAALRALDIFDDMKGGVLRANGGPLANGGPRDISGQAKIENFQIEDAPALARLISAMSLPGILELFQNRGIAFRKLESRFEILNREGGMIYRFRDGRTSGSELGITFDGVFNRIKDSTDINGTIVPASSVNTLLGRIPLLGDVLTGGKGGGVFAATYRIRGSSKDPKVSINPLSVLAPGFLRRMFFESDALPD